MISGHDVLHWFATLWADITNPMDADIPSLLARLALLFFGFLIVKGILKTLWRVLYRETAAPLLSGLLRAITWPIWKPYTIVRDWHRHVRDVRAQERSRKEWERQNRDRLAMQEAEQQQQQQAQEDELSRLERMLRID